MNDEVGGVMPQTTLVVCNMENFDPVGPHRGPIVFAQRKHCQIWKNQMLRDASLKIIQSP